MRDDSKKQHKTKETLDSKDEKVNLLDLVRDKARSDLYVVNVDDELTETIKKTFEKHGCQVSVSKLEKDLIALYVLLNKKISIKKLRKLRAIIFMCFNLDKIAYFFKDFDLAFLDKEAYNI